jgi:hypothetical protein
VHSRVVRRGQSARRQAVRARVERRVQSALRQAVPAPVRLSFRFNTRLTTWCSLTTSTFHSQRLNVHVLKGPFWSWSPLMESLRVKARISPIQWTRCLSLLEKSCGLQPIMPLDKADKEFVKGFFEEPRKSFTVKDDFFLILCHILATPLDYHFTVFSRVTGRPKSKSAQLRFRHLVAS